MTVEPDKGMREMQKQIVCHLNIYENIRVKNAFQP